ncbi:hypothetical protein C8R47DRAFT_244421 [Mycena vitilis]|nr:hypothetical protein C8R47DRAFT_244421 [Mycena vitilis]
MPIRFKSRWSSKTYLEDQPPEWPVSTFMIYLPKGSPSLLVSQHYAHRPAATHASSRPRDPKVTNPLKALAHTVPSGGMVCSTHYPKEAISWVEAHYSDRLLASIRARGLGGPMATMLFPERQALAIFGSIKKKAVLIAAQALADASGYAVIIQPRSDDPVLSWNAPTEIPRDPADETEELDDGESITSGGSDSGDGPASEMAPPTGDEAIDDSAPWMSPVHKSNMRLQLSLTSNLTHDITITLETQFTLQTAYRRRNRGGPRPNIVSRTHLEVTSDNLQVLPDRSYGCVVFSTPDHDLRFQHCLCIKDRLWFRPADTSYHRDRMEHSRILVPPPVRPV